MGARSLTIRPATQADFLQFYGITLPTMAKAIVAVNGDDTPLAVGGYLLFQSVAVAFGDSHKGMTSRNLVRAARVWADLLKKLDCEVIAYAEPGGDTLLRHFGFEPCDGSLDVAYRLIPA